MGNNQGIENNFKIQAKKQHQKQMPISMVNVTLLLTSLLKFIEFFKCNN